MIFFQKDKEFMEYDQDLINWDDHFLTRYFGTNLLKYFSLRLKIDAEILTASGIEEQFGRMAISENSEYSAVSKAGSTEIEIDEMFIKDLNPSEHKNIKEFLKNFRAPSNASETTNSKSILSSCAINKKIDKKVNYY